MSPTEFELRAALRDGEDAGLDPDLVVTRAETYRRQRRTRLLGAASVAAVVAAIGITGTLAWQSDGHSDNGAAAAMSDQAGGAAAPIAPHTAPRNGAYSSTLTICLDAAPTPTGTKLDRRVGAGPIFGNNITSVSICAYRGSYTSAQKTAGPAATTVTGTQATALVDSINSARTTRPGICPQYRTLDSRQYVLVGMDDRGHLSAPVVVTLAGNPCQTTVSNGTAIRYEWSPPPRIATILAQLGAKGAIASVPAPSQS